MTLNSFRSVITGMGIFAPGGIGKASFWERLLSGKTAIDYISLFDADALGLPCRIAGEVKEFSPNTWLPSQIKVKRLNRLTQLGLAASIMASEDAGWSIDQVPTDTGLFVGVSSVDANAAFEYLESIHKHGFDKRINPLSTYVYLPGYLSEVIYRTLNLQQFNSTVSTGCSSSIDAFIQAIPQIERGALKRALVGGSEAPVNPYYFASYAASGLVTDDPNEKPETASRPYAFGRSCGVVSEGAAFLMIESLPQALARGATIYAEIIGWGTAPDDPHSQHGEHLRKSMTYALANAGLYPGDIDYICGHGPGHPIMDLVEVEAIKDVFGAAAFNVPVSSIKGVTGNCLGATGTLQLASASLALHTGWIPPTANGTIPDPKCNLDHVFEGPRQTHPTHALVNVHGVGGNNTSVILKRVEPLL